MVINSILASATRGQPEPVVGMGATVLHWTDRTPATIVEVIQAKQGVVVAVTDDSYKVVSGSVMDGSAVYEFTPQPDDYKSYYQLREGRWVSVVPAKRPGMWKLGGGNGLRIGERDKYYDPSF